jgi:hypothetical protein
MPDSKLQKWVNEHTVKNEMLWKGAWGRQIEFVRDTLCALMAAGLNPAQDRPQHHQLHELSAPQGVAGPRSARLLLPRRREGRLHEDARPEADHRGGATLQPPPRVLRAVLVSA